MMKRDPFDTPGQDRAREELEYQRQQRLLRFRDQLKNLMSTKDGRELVFSLLDLCQVNAGSFSTNALTMAYAEGRRAVGLDLQRFLDPDLYLTMLREVHGRNKQR